MNHEKLRLAEAHFLQVYPGGFSDPAIQEIGKRHQVDRMITLAKQVFARKSFNQPNTFVENLAKLVSRSSMVSMFEKPRFRDMINDMNSDEREELTAAFRRMFHGNQSKGFTEVVDILARWKLAKWSLVTIGMVYYRPQKEVFVKPTTAKDIIRKLELELEYRPRPYWEFYAGYRAAILDIKSRVDPSLSPNNAALTGFLMMSL